MRLSEVDVSRSFYFFKAVPSGQKHAKARPCDGGLSARLSSCHRRLLRKGAAAKASHGVGLRLRASRDKGQWTNKKDIAEQGGAEQN